MAHRQNVHETQHNDTSQGKSIAAPIINPMARDRLQRLLQRTMSPLTVEQVLSSAIDGDLRNQSLVFIAMLDTWPRLRKAISEVAKAVARAPFEVQPWCGRNEEPTPEAIAQAEFVEDAIFSLRPDPACRQYDLEGIIETMVFGYYTGHSVSEILYHRPTHPELREIHSFAPVSAEHYGYPRSSDEADRLMLNVSGHYNGQLSDFSDYPNQFLVGVNRAHMGHASIAAPLRSLVQWWLGAHYGLKWFMQFAQQFGSPIRWATYPNGDHCAMNLVSEMLANMGMLSWGAFPEGTNLEIKESSKGAGDLPQKTLIEMADRQADIAILGQSLTTDVADSGSRALGDVHSGVRHDVIDGVAQWVAKILTHQLVPAALNARPGDDIAEMPEICVTWPECEDEKTKAERDEILFSKMGLPVGEQWIYDRHGVPRPEPGEQTLTLKQQVPPALQAPPDDATEEAEAPDPAAIEARSAAGPSRVLDRPVIDKLTDNVLENLSGEAAVFLAGVRPVFRDLVRMSLDGEVSDQAFIAAVQRAADTMPELFESLNVEALQEAMERAIGTGMLAGVGERIISAK